MGNKEFINLRDMIADEVEYQGLDDSVTDAALRYINNTARLLERLDEIVADAIRAVKDK
jgi:hypothetical protein